MIPLAARLVLIALAYPFLLMVAFLVAHAAYCTIHGRR